MIQVTCAIIVKDEKVLVAQRSELMKQPLKWEFPGGKVEANESAEACLIREIQEELSLHIEIQSSLPAHTYDYGTFQINLIPFVAKPLSEQIVLKEHATYAWLNRDELLTLDWAPADIAIVHDFLHSY
ncbi:(deoxy)nucleoside triphosphate pyrophosphohydrolase [Cytophagaceae bacterium DM2B3-1]|uniref:8-oxo-dGTP diphosphatase n=2 Tax=Xanthocytophaga TaxID=3078918 RepID=A0ABT7CSW4_9BACT|nr:MULTISPECIES: (deoxy)nucleoside triphosphate pyrophosphohydrolase [Xanthocytophaga]MDJ1496823.1 (deoxy)nucleoside triphosphate pyrophosphohydrolase [Xanthocytophaga flavus]MDJ1505418.1 (deoxy)nucleoside triphosphate pyrophosphohydrolase [Xanthocytophaga agilis]